MRCLFVVLSVLVYPTFGFCQADVYLDIKPQATTTITDAKPQAKVWAFQNTFFTVFPDDQGTHIWKLSDLLWEKHFTLTALVNTKADCLAQSDSVFMVLFQGNSSVFCALKFDKQQQKYQFLNKANPLVAVPFDTSVETVTIAMDTQKALWMTYETRNNIVIRQANHPYVVWSNPQNIHSGVADDDISAIVKMPNSIGVLWSDQNTRRFGFKSHTDGAPISEWSIDEVPASQSALNVGEGMADDHINIKCSASGDLFVAIKTSYDMPQQTKIGLLIRRANGIWDDLYHVSDTGTRPIVTLDEAKDRIRVYYTSKEAGGDIVYKESSVSNINFGKKPKVILNGTYNNVSSTKTPYRGSNVIIASDEKQVVGKLISNY